MSVLLSLLLSYESLFSLLLLSLELLLPLSLESLLLPLSKVVMARMHVSVDSFSSPQSSQPGWLIARCAKNIDIAILLVRIQYIDSNYFQV